MSSNFVFDTEGGAEVAVAERTEVPAEMVQEIEELAPVANELGEEQRKTTPQESELPQAKATATRPLERPQINSVASVPHVENNTAIVSENIEAKKRFRTRVKERVVTFAKNYAHNLNPRGKDKFWWAGAVGKLGATVTAAVVAPFAVPAVALSTASFRVGTYGAEKLNQRVHKKRLGEEGFTSWMKQRQTRYPEGVGRAGRVARGTSIASLATAIGVAL